MSTLLRRVKRKIWAYPRGFLFGLSIIIILLLFYAIGIQFIPPLPEPYDFGARLMPPDKVHFMGTDDLGRDVLARLIRGVGISMKLAFVPIISATLIGTFLGAIGALRGGFLDMLILSLMDIVQSIPVYFLILTVLAAIEPNGKNVMIAIGITSWPQVARLIRAEILSLKSRPFIEAAHSMGASDWWIITKHLLPNVSTPILVSFALGMSTAILTESSLSYLGLGVEPETPSLGNVLAAGRNMYGQWWLSFFPGMMIFLVILGFNLISEGLRDYLDPRIKKALKAKNGVH